MLRDSVQEEFEAFHRANPSIYVMLVKLARQMRSIGYERLSMGLLWEMLRHRAMTTNPNDPYYQPEGKPLKMPNAHRSRYARLIMIRETGLLDSFRIAKLRTKRVAVVAPLAPGEQAVLL